MKPYVKKRNQTVNKHYQSFLTESVRQKVAEVLYRFPDKEFSLSDLAKVAHVQKQNLGRILAEFEKAQFIEITKLSKIWRIRANVQNWVYIRNKIIYNLNFVYQSGLVEYLNDAYQNPKAIVLFGSFRQGEDTSSSDIDIAIETSAVREHQTVLLEGLEPFETAIGRRIQLHVFGRGSKSSNPMVDPNVFCNIANGIVLSGFLEVRP